MKRIKKGEKMLILPMRFWEKIIVLWFVYVMIFLCVVDLGKDNCVTIWGVVGVKEEEMGFG